MDEGDLILQLEKCPRSPRETIAIDSAYNAPCWPGAEIKAIVARAGSDELGSTDGLNQTDTFMVSSRATAGAIPTGWLATSCEP